MRILILSQYFWPEAFIVNDLARKLTEIGHSVTVATGKPNYPTGKISPGYTAYGVQREMFADDIEIIRIPIAPRGNASAISLSLNYLSFVFSGLLCLPWLLRKHRFDVVLVFAISPLTAAIPAILVSKLKRAHMALWIQDLWPDSLLATGFVRSRWLLRSVAIMVRYIYRLSDTLLVQSEAFAAPVGAYDKLSKIFYLPNFAPDIPSDDVAVLPDDIEDMVKGHFCVLFAGNLGKAQSLDTIIRAAFLLRDHPEIRIIIAGDGSEADHVKRLVQSMSLTNVCFTGPVDRALMPKLFKIVDLLLVTLRNEPTLCLTIPSKIQAYLQAGRPIVGALNGEGARIIGLSGSGMTVAAEDEIGLANLFLTLYLMPAIRRETMGSAGKAYFDSHFEVNGLVNKLVALLEARTKGTAP